jgi:hypothetical protein
VERKVALEQASLAVSTMPVPKNEYMSDVWKEGIFGMSLIPLTSEDVNTYDVQLIRLCSVLVVLDPFAAHKYEQ